MVNPLEGDYDRAVQWSKPDRALEVSRTIRLACGDLWEYVRSQHEFAFLGAGPEQLKELRYRTAAVQQFPEPWNYGRSWGLNGRFGSVAWLAGTPR